jgi:hypothetical protein
MEELKQNFINYGILPKISVLRIFKKIRKEKKIIDNNRILAHMIEDFDLYIDSEGNSLQELVPNYMEYKYKKIELISRIVFAEDKDLDLILKITDVIFNCHMGFIETESNSTTEQSPEQRSDDFIDVAMKLSDAIGGSNIRNSTAYFKWQMVSMFAINVKKKTIKKIKPFVEKSMRIALQNKCVVCDHMALSKCGKCGLTNYCSKDCQKIHWKSHKYECNTHC